MQAIQGALILWFILTGLSTLYVLYDQLTNTPSMRVMTLAWVLILLYTGPLGLFIYFITCRQPLPNTHDEYIKDHYKQAIGSEIHCVAGDATAIIIMAAILHYFDLPNGIEAILEYIAAYLFGLFIFQALFMLNMFSSYFEAVKKTIFAETVSMNMIMAGMLPIIILLKHYFPEGSNPETLMFWGIMTVATIVGSVFGYPINSWMVKRGIKHGMMSRPQSGKSHEHHHMQTNLSKIQGFWMIIGTYAFLVLVAYFVSFFAPIYF